jgi:hypothetical protein
MEATRVRVTSMLEWAVAACLILAALGIGSVVAREFRTVAAATTRVIADEVPAPVLAAPAGVPSRAVSVPVLILPDGLDVRVGESLTDIAARLGRQAEVGTESVERAPNGERLTRFYEQGGTRFVLVFEPFEQNAEPRVAAIYLQ